MVDDHHMLITDKAATKLNLTTVQKDKVKHDKYI